MLKAIFEILLVIVAIVIFCAAGSNIEKVQYGKDKVTWKFNRKCLFSIIPLIVFVILSSTASVPANTVGVKWSAFGGTSETTLNEGITFKIPFVDKIYTIPTTVQERTIKNVSVQTKDAQFVKMEVNVKFQVSKQNAFKVYKRYGDIDNMKQNIIGNYAQKSVETIVTQYNVIEVLGEKKNEVYTRATADLKDKLAKEGVELTSLTIKDMDAGKEIEDAISKEAVAKKAVETAKQEKEKALIVAEKKKIEAQGEADSNAIKTSKLTEAVLKEMLIKKWNGQLPKVTSSENMLDITSLLK
uniref:prohibitin family protein n=1 Tax=Longicatena caecimuris TaxID=1796635 RepID=UPI0022E0300B|nr:prohibitin family protein [Longicatena caecimuris]